MTDHELPPPIGYATHSGMRSLRQDSATVLLYAHDYLIRPDPVPLFTADQMREYGRARERAAYERAVKVCEELEAELNAKADLYPGGESDIAWRLARRIEALGAEK